MHTLTCIGSSVVPDLRQSKWASQLWVGVRGPLVLLWDIQYIGNCTTPLGKETRNSLDNKRGLFWVRMLCTWQLHSLRGWCPPPSQYWWDNEGLHLNFCQSKDALHNHYTPNKFSPGTKAVIHRCTYYITEVFKWVCNAFMSILCIMHPKT